MKLYLKGRVRYVKFSIHRRVSDFTETWTQQSYMSRGIGISVLLSALTHNTFLVNETIAPWQRELRGSGTCTLV